MRRDVNKRQGKSSNMVLNAKCGHGASRTHRAISKDSSAPLRPYCRGWVTILQGALVSFHCTKTRQFSDQAHSLLLDDAFDHELCSLHCGPVSCRYHSCSDSNGDRHKIRSQPDDDNLHYLFGSHIYGCVGLPPSLDCSVCFPLQALTEAIGLTRDRWCMVGDEEYQVSGPTATEEFQAEYTDCHSHSSEM